MKRIKLLAIMAACAASTILGTTALHAEDAVGGYSVLKTIPLGGDGRFDYVTYDPQSQRLYLTRTTYVMVVDPNTGAITGKVDGGNGLHGVAIANGKGYASNGKGNCVQVFDIQTLKVETTVPVGAGSDAIIYDPASKHVFSFNGKGQSVTPINIDGNKAEPDIDVGGKPEAAVADGNQVFLNVEDKNEIAVIDTTTMKVTAHWPLGADEPSGLAMDADSHRLFSGCSGSNKLVVMDSANGKVITTLPIGAHEDTICFDPATKNIFSSNGDGTLTIIHEDSPDKYTVTGNLTTAPGARTSAVDPISHKVYLETGDFEPAQEGQRPKMKPGSFKVIIVGKQ